VSDFEGGDWGSRPEEFGADEGRKRYPAPATIGTMPNKPKTPHRTIRIDDALWSAAQAAAEAEGKTLTEVIRAALTRYVKRSKA
jgi:predicted HicB family RNase H-like nuclease